MFGEDELVKQHKHRSEVIINIIIICFGIVLSRLWYLQIYKGEDLYQYSLRNRLKRVVVTAPRGMIFSRNDFIMVDNIPRFDAVLVPQFLRDRKKTIKTLSGILNLSESQIKKILKKNRRQAKYKPIIIKKNISRKEVALLETENANVPGVSVETFISREYVDSEAGAHLLGYISQISEKDILKYQERDQYDYKANDFIGIMGVEKKFDLKLRGKNGHEFVEVDALGRKKKHIATDNFFKGITNKKSVPGLNVRLTVDRDLQLVGFKALEGMTGSVVAMDVNSGEVLAMVSRPSFNPSVFSRELRSNYWKELITNPNRPFRDRTIMDHYAPGSTFKTITALAALEEGLIDEKTEINCTGKFKFGRRTYHCWKYHGHGKTNVIKSIRESCDVFFYKIATKIDIDVLARYARMFGLGSKTGINLPRETSGLIPTKAWKEKYNGEPWQKGETLSCVIGQSYVLATPLQIASAYALIANGGKIFRPKLIKEMFSNSGDVVEKSEPEIKDEITFSEKNLKLIREGLYQVANHPKGTVWWRRGKGLQMSGKTGTSQVISESKDKLFQKCEKKSLKSRHHALFVGYAPKVNPKIVVSAVIEHGCSGSKTASPVVVAVIDKYMEKYYPKLKANYAKMERSQFIKFIKKRNAQKEKEEAEKEDEVIVNEGDID